MRKVRLSSDPVPEYGFTQNPFSPRLFHNPTRPITLKDIENGLKTAFVIWFNYTHTGHSSRDSYYGKDWAELQEKVFALCDVLKIARPQMLCLPQHELDRLSEDVCKQVGFHGVKHDWEASKALCQLLISEAHYFYHGIEKPSEAIGNAIKAFQEAISLFKISLDWE
jgi:hypothetical protein